MIQCLLRIFEDVTWAKMRKITLLLHMDNCFRDNRNVYVIGFLNALVELRLLVGSRIHFLPIGHTHEEVDGWFGRLAVRV